MNLEVVSYDRDHTSEASVKVSSRSNIRNPGKTPPDIKVPDDPGDGVICQDSESWRMWRFLMNMKVVSYDRNHHSEAS